MSTFKRKAINQFRIIIVFNYLFSIWLAFLLSGVTPGNSDRLKTFFIVLVPTIIVVTIIDIFLLIQIKKLSKQTIVISNESLSCTGIKSSTSFLLSEIDTIVEKRKSNGKLKFFFLKTQNQSLTIADYVNQNILYDMIMKNYSDKIKIEKF